MGNKVMYKDKDQKYLILSTEITTSKMPVCFLQYTFVQSYKYMFHTKTKSYF